MKARDLMAKAEGGPVELGDARNMVEQAETFVAAMRAEFLPEPCNDESP